MDDSGSKAYLLSRHSGNRFYLNLIEARPNRLSRIGRYRLQSNDEHDGSHGEDQCNQQAAESAFELVSSDWAVLGELDIGGFYGRDSALSLIHC